MNYQELNFAISVCKQNLKLTDYKAIKYAEGLLTDKEYKPIKEDREEWRRQINEYEALLPDAKAEWENAVEEPEYLEIYEEDGETDI